MAIEETRKKITFVPFEIKKGREVDTSPAPTVTTKNGALRFSKKYIDEQSLNHQFVKFFYDPIKNVVGWQVKKQVSLEAVGKTWKMVNQNAKTGFWSVSIGKMLAIMDAKHPEREWHKLPVQKHVEANGMDKGTVTYFVELVVEVNHRKPKEEEPQPTEVPAADLLDTALEHATQAV